VCALQVPAQVQYSMVSYFAMPANVDPSSLLGQFIHEKNDTFRNVRFKLIPVVCKGPWVVQKTVGTTPLIVGGALKVSTNSSASGLNPQPVHQFISQCTNSSASAPIHQPVHSILSQRTNSSTSASAIALNPIKEAPIHQPVH
jgi:hypothetical protein